VSGLGIDSRVTGTQRYSIDAERPDMLHAAFVRSPHPHARVISVDASQVPSDCVALLPEDVGDLHLYGCQVRDEYVLSRVARYAGDIVAAVAAPSREAARHAARLVDVRYEELPAVFDPVGAVSPGAPLLHPDGAQSAGEAVSIGVRPLAGTNACHRFRLVHGDVAAGFAQADVVVQQAFRTPSAAHAPMEPHAAVAEWHDGRLTVWTGTQTPFNLRADLSVAFGIEEERIRVIAIPMGGSFGAKTFVRHEGPLAALARKAGRPVKVVLDRTEEFVTLNRHPSVIRVRVGAKRDGTLVAKELDCWVDTGAYADCGPGVATKLGYAGVGPYRIPHVRVDALAIYTNLPPNGAYRGYGAMQSIWASERTMDVLAERLDMSPLELRRKNLLRDGDVFATGEVMHDVQFERCLQAAADAVDYERDPMGKGLCVLLKGMQTPSRAAISVERGPVGYVIRSAACEMGQGVRRSLQLMGAQMLGCEPGQIEIPEPDTDTSPFDTRTTSSRTTHMMGRALEGAVRDLHENGGDRGYGEVHNEGGLDPDTGQGIASTHWHQGAAAAHVTVDEETGKLTVEHLHGVAYAGRVVNREGAELQNDGSLIMGLGTALFEAIDFADGQVTNANLSDYNVPAIGDLPKRFTHELIERDGAEVHGLGETVLPPVPAAIGNALYSLGLELHHLPMSAERVLDAVDARDARTPAAGARDARTPAAGAPEART
jgi:CO/xanthine dehydrogenase Mo-binding subunit